MLKCSECNYYYQTSEDDFPCCHYIDLYEIAPCEYDDDDYEEEQSSSTGKFRRTASK